MRKSAPIEVVVHYPKTEEGWEELGKRVATAHANYVIEKIERLNCPTWQKLELYQAVIDTTTRVPISPRNTRNPAGSPAGKQRAPRSTYAQYMTAFNRNFGGSSGGGGGGGNHNNNGGGGGDGSGCGCLIAIAVVVVLILIVLGG